MIDDNLMCAVTNRSSGILSFSVPSEHIHRTFQRGETKMIPYKELRMLAGEPGGECMIENFLIVRAAEVLKEMGVKTEREYFYGPEEIAKLITAGSLDEFLDCLDFAPKGVIDMIKTMSVGLPMTDMKKIEALKKKTGYDVLSAIRNNEAAKEEDPVEEAPRAERRVKDTPVEDKPGRRVVVENN